MIVILFNTSYVYFRNKPIFLGTMLTKQDRKLATQLF
jgi:hypothetical protein